MSDYTQSTFFTPKDALISGDPLKVIKGADIDPELSAISNSLMTKVDDTGEVATFVVLIDPGADRIVFWDDSATGYKFLQTGEGITIGGTTISADIDSLPLFSALDTTLDHLAVYDASGTNLVKVPISSVTGTRTVTAGAGMTGGGALSADITLNVIAGTGITVNADDVAIDTAHTRNVDHSAVSITAGVGLTGGGTIAATRTVDLDISALTNTTINATAEEDSILINDGGTMKQIDIKDMGIRVITSASTKTFSLVDSNTLQLLTGASGITWTIPPNSTVAFNIGTIVYLGSRDTATLTISPGAGVTATSKDQSSNADQSVRPGGLAALIKVSTDEWMFAGDIN